MVSYNPEERKRPPNISVGRKKPGKRLSTTGIGINLRKKYLNVSTYFLSFGVLNFTSLSFTTILFPIIIYYLLSPNDILGENYLKIDFGSLAILIISLVNSVTDFVYGIASRFSGRFTSSIKSPRQGLVMFYLFNFPLAWFSFFLILILNLSAYWKLVLIVIIFLARLIISGLTSGLHWQLYYDITTSEYRSSQESYLNTITLIIYTIGFSILGQILEIIGLIEAILFLFILGLLAILILFKAKEPDVKSTEILTRTSK